MDLKKQLKQKRQVSRVYMYMLLIKVVEKIHYSELNRLILQVTLHMYIIIKRQ